MVNQQAISRNIYEFILELVIVNIVETFKNKLKKH